MDKISGILSASSRVTAVDMKEATPVRTGVPAFGRPEKEASVRAPSSLGQTAMKSAGVQAEVQDWKSKDAERAAIAAKMSDQFFNKTPAAPVERPMKSSVRETESMGSTHLPMLMSEASSTPAGFKTDEAGSFRAASRQMPTLNSFDDDEEITLKQPDGLFPKGSFIDRTA
jgi:hypothetical protein